MGLGACSQNLVLLTRWELLQPVWARAALGAPRLHIPFPHERFRGLPHQERWKAGRGYPTFLGVCTHFGVGKASPTHPPPWLFQAGKNWMFSNAKSPPHCELMAGHLRNRITADGAHFELRLHLIYLINDVLHHW